jgi:hypothetical protein
MTSTELKAFIDKLSSDNDAKNLADIRDALKSGRLDTASAEYLTDLYSNGMEHLRQVFYIIGRTLGAPKTAVYKYDTATSVATELPVSIAEINPMQSYMVGHRLDADPMRNQFFTIAADQSIELSVSSIVGVIIAAQKKFSRALDKITGKYYNEFTDNVCDAAAKVLTADGRAASAAAIADKIRAKFAEKYATNAAEVVLGIIGQSHQKIAVEMVREIDRITPPHLRLQDVWRAKFLFDMVPQARTFIERVHDLMPDRVLRIRDSFYDLSNQRNYRDAKMILNIGTGGKVVPMEFIIQVRCFFNYEIKTHEAYEKLRKKGGKSADLEHAQALTMEGGIREYNKIVCGCLDDLLQRAGWNVLYQSDDGSQSGLLEGFPKITKLYYPQKIVDAIMDKLDKGVKNEIFRLFNVSRKLTPDEEIKIFRFMARFVLVSAMPYSSNDWKENSDDPAAKIFNFVMTEVQRYYKK